VLEHLLNHGSITTEQLAKDYGYNHPPRAAQDVRDLNIELRTTRVKSSDGRRNIANYELVDFSGLLGERDHRVGGRRSFPKKFKAKLINVFGARCNICLLAFPASILQIDHRVPFQVLHDSEGDRTTDGLQLVCGSCNRAKSWTCEHCPNWQKTKDHSICEKCYWGSPEIYSHIATENIRRLDLGWSGKEIADYDSAKKQAEAGSMTLPDFVKRALRKAISRR
jgi:hypothetical protein